MLSSFPRGLRVYHGESQFGQHSSWKDNNCSKQFLLAAGLQYEKSSRATNMVYTQMLFALAFDKLVWGTTPGTLSIIGSSLILGSAIYVAMHKEDSNRDEDGERGNGLNRDEEIALMSPEIEAEVRGRDVDIQMHTLRV